MAATEPSAAVALAEAKAQELEPITAEVLASAESFEITTAPQYEQSASLLKTIKGKQTELDDLRKSITKPLDDAKARVMDLFRPPTERLRLAENTLKGAIVFYQQAQERVRQEEERKAREAAEKEAERLRKQADKARAQGKEDKADELEERAETMPVPIIASQAPQVSGVVIRKTWRAEVTDLSELVAAVALTVLGQEGGQPLLLLQPNMKVLDNMARSLHTQLRVPGVRAVSDDGVAARGA